MNTIGLIIAKKLNIIKKQLNSFLKLKMKKQVLRSLFKLLKAEGAYEKILEGINNIITGKDIVLPAMTGTPAQVKYANDIKAHIIASWNRFHGSYGLAECQKYWGEDNPKYYKATHQTPILLAVVKTAIIEFLTIANAPTIIGISKKQPIISKYLADHGWYDHAF
jgi:hypothetical protein